MKRLGGKIARALAPRTMATLADMAEVRTSHGSLKNALDAIHAAQADIDTLSRENRQLREEIDELRREGRYVAELYDLVLERVRADAKS
jgi:cell division protein FtsB